MPDSASSADTRMPRAARWVLYVGGGLLALVLAVALLLPQFFTSDQLKGYVIPPMEEATGRQVEIDEIGLRVLLTPAVRVSGFRLANREGYGPEPAVEAGELNVEVALWPLFTGSIEPTAIELVDPVIRYEVAEDGATNYDDLMAVPDTAQAEAEGGGGLPIPVSNFRTTGAQIRYQDRSTGQTLFFDFDAQLSALPDGDTVTSGGTVNVQSLRAVLPDVQADTMTVTDAQIDYDVRAALSAGRVELSTFTLTTAPLTLSITGTIDRLNTRPAVDLTVETTEADLGKLAAFAPAAAVEGLNPQGAFQLNTTVQGVLPDDSGALDSLAVDGTGRFSGVGMDYQGTTLLRDLSVDLALSLDTIALSAIQGQLLGKSLTGEITVRDLMESPRVDGRLAGAADLGQLASLAAAEDPMDVSGQADYDVRFAGPVDNPDAIRPNGQIRFTNVRYPYASFRHPIEVPDATVQLTGTGLSMDRFTMRTGEQTMALATTVRNLFPLSKGLAETNPAMAVDFTFTSDRLDLVELYPEEAAGDTTVYYSQLFAATLSGSKVKGQSPETLAKELYGGIELPAYAVDGDVNIKTFLNPPQRVDNLAFDVQMRDRRLELRNLSGSTYGGQLAGTLTFDQSGSAATSSRPQVGSVMMAARGTAVAPRVSSSSDLNYDFRLNGARASAFLEDWTTLGRVVKGTLDLKIGGDTPLTEGMLPLASALTAKGNSIVADGGLSLNLGVAKALVDRLGIDASSLTNFKRFGGPFTIENGQLKMGEWTLGGQTTNARLSGALGLGGSVDVDMRMALPLSTIQNSKIGRLVGTGDGVGNLLQKLTGAGKGSETIPVRIGIGGTMSEPTVEIVDKGAVKSALQDLAKQEGLNRLRNLFDGGKK